MRNDDPRTATALAEDVLVEAGFTIRQRDVRLRGAGVSVSFEATDEGGATWLFDVVGPYTSARGGMTDTDVVLIHLGKAAVVRAVRPATPLVLLTTALPRRPGDADVALRAAQHELVHDVVLLVDDVHRARLAAHAASGIQA